MLGHETGTDGVLRPAEIWGMPRSLGPAGTINATAVELAPLPDGRFAGRWPFQTAWTPVRFLRLAAGDVLHVSGRATPRLPAG